jgi:hypothetical protein
MRCDMCIFWNSKNNKICLRGNNRREHGSNPEKYGYELIMIKGCGFCKIRKYHTMGFETCQNWRVTLFLIR